MATEVVIASTGGESNVSGGLVCGIVRWTDNTQDIFVPLGFVGASYDMVIWEELDHIPIYKIMWHAGMTVGGWWLTAGTGAGHGSMGNNLGGPYFGEGPDGTLGLIIPATFIGYVDEYDDLTTTDALHFRIWR